MSDTRTLHGKPRQSATMEYNGLPEYREQGDDRIVRDLMFSYLVQYEDPAKNRVLEPVDVPRGTKISVDEMGVIAWEKGERQHSFYTSDERAILEAGGDPSRPAALQEDAVSEMGEHELAEYISGSNPSNKKLTVDQVLELAGTDKDLAHRLLMAENIATDGDPRSGVEHGLNAIINDSNAG